jgi:ribosomal protein L11 methyltransferase
LNWLEVSLTVNGELAEAVADVLARFAPNGVTTEQAVTYNDAEDEGTAVGPITVRAYLPADEHLEETRARLEESLHYLGMIQTLPAPTFTPLADQNWMEAWKARYQPIPIGKRLIIVPAWLKSPDESRLPIRIDPGMAFGTGTHPTTQLCLEFIEEFFTDRLVPGEGEFLPDRPIPVIDVGCGSGILSIGALKLGASFALGVDIDPASVQASRENAEANDIPNEQFFIGLGSVAEILEGGFSVRTAPLVLANILAPVLVRLLDAGMAKLVEPGGSIVLSGILEEQAESVVSASQANGLALTGRKQIADWVALTCKRG